MTPPSSPDRLSQPLPPEVRESLSFLERLHFEIALRMNREPIKAFWTAVQIRNHRHAIASFEVLVGDTWVGVPRVDYNYFVKDDGMGAGPLSFRVTDVVGNVLEDSGIPLLDDADAPGSMQFPACE